MIEGGRPCPEGTQMTPRDENVPASSGRRMSLLTQMLLIYTSIGTTVVAGALVFWLTHKFVLIALHSGSMAGTLVPIFGFCITCALLFGNIMHQVASLGHLKMRRDTRPPTADELHAIYDTEAPPIRFIVPSFRENLRLVRYTLLSAALQEYPDRRVTLLIDDPPYPSDAKGAEALRAACRLPRDLDMLLARQAAPLQRALEAFVERMADSAVDVVGETRRVAKLYRGVSTWFLRQAAAIEPTDHMDRLFVEGLLLKRARAHAEYAQALKQRARDKSQCPGPKRLLRVYRRLAAQYVVHMGFTRYSSVFWVGANAVIRKEALDDIRIPIEERGFTVSKYIQDRTHIEDTESTIDLVEKGWSLYSSPRQFAFSATPDDFGSLLIQRRRWANGGLIIFPKLLRYLLSRRKVPHRFFQGILRSGYLINLSLGSVAVLATLVYPLPNGLIFCLGIAGLGYAMVYGADLLRMGFRLRDLPQIYSLNLMMIPINLGGAAKSIHQAWTGKKTPFHRTPKVKGRTLAPFLYVAAEYALLLFCMFVGIIAFGHGKIGHGIWALANALVFVHIIANLMGDHIPWGGAAVEESG